VTGFFTHGRRTEEKRFESTCLMRARGKIRLPDRQGLSIAFFQRHVLTSGSAFCHLGRA
jgi:hypothetical protein